MVTVADLLVDELRRRGIEAVYTLVGNGLEPLLSAALKAGLKVIGTRNEQAAGYMADAAARLTRRVAVAAVSTGVAHVNALTGLCNAWFDGSPMLLITSASDSAREGRGCFQDMDTSGLSRPLCKSARRVNRPEAALSLLREALDAALAGRPGPVQLTIPLDVLRAEAFPEASPGSEGRPAVYDCRAAADAAAVGEAIRLIRKSSRPLIIAGTGAFYAEASDSLARLARLMAAPVTVPIWDRGAVEEPIPEFIGVIGSVSGGPRVLPDADLILLSGCRVDYRLGYLEPPAVAPGTPVIRCDIDPAELVQGLRPDVAMLCDVRTGLTQLADSLQGQGHKGAASWLAEVKRRDREFRRPWIEAAAPVWPPITGRHLVDALRPVLTGDTYFVIDGGNIGQWVHMALCDHYPARWLTCGASAVVGCGLPAAIAVRSVHPGKRVLLLSGDGSVTFTLAEIEVAVRQKLPFVCVVADDCTWGIIASSARRQGGTGIGTDLGPIRFDQVAEGLGARGLRIEDPGLLRGAIEEGFASDRPTVIHVPIAWGGPTDG